MKHITLSIVIGIVSSQCVEPFNPSIEFQHLDVLVVEGYINAGDGQTIIKLSQAKPLGSSQQFFQEKDAIIMIESSTEDRYALMESTDGIYISPDLNLSVENEYRLYIKLKNGKEYRSQFMPVKITPKIDSTYWEAKSGMIQIYVNTHDVSSNTHYYQWTYKEDWQIRSVELPIYIYQDDTVKFRDPEELLLMFNCWKSSQSEKILISSSKKLTLDAVSYSVHQIPFSAEKTSVRYSIIVKQHTLQEDEYNYLNLMLKNQEMGGAFFDPMPAQLYGNIRNVNKSNEMVIGYIGAYTTQSDTLFIRPSELPFDPAQQHCQRWEFEMTDQENLNRYMRPPTYYEVISTWTEGGKPWMAIIERSCIDCRIHGSTLRPSFWD